MIPFNTRIHRTGICHIDGKCQIKKDPTRAMWLDFFVLPCNIFEFCVLYNWKK